MGYDGQAENLFIVQGDYRHREISERRWQGAAESNDLGPMHGGFRLDCEGVKEINDVVEMVESDAAALQALDQEMRNPPPHANSALASTAMMRFA